MTQGYKIRSSLLIITHLLSQVQLLQQNIVQVIEEEEVGCDALAWISLAKLGFLQLQRFYSFVS